MGDFLKKYWLLFLGAFFVLFVVTLLLMLVTSKPQESGFVYQIN